MSSRISLNGNTMAGAMNRKNRVGISHAGHRLMLPPTPNLLVNPGFESNSLIGWTPTDKNSVAVMNASIDATSVSTPHSGKYWVKSTNDGNGVQQTAPVTPGSTYRLSLWHACGAPDGNRWVTMKIANADTGTTIKSSISPARLTTDWVQESMEFTTPADCTRVTLTITEGSWLRLDDVELREVLPGQPIERNLAPAWLPTPNQTMDGMKYESFGNRFSTSFDKTKMSGWVTWYSSRVSLPAGPYTVYANGKGWQALTFYDNAGNNIGRINANSRLLFKFDAEKTVEFHVGFDPNWFGGTAAGETVILEGDYT